MAGLDRRSHDEFRAEVEEWQNRSKELLDEVVSEFLRHHLARGCLIIRNESDRYLEGVRVQVQFPPGVVVLMESDTDHRDPSGEFSMLQLLPDRPSKYGDLQLPDIPGLAGAPIGPSAGAAIFNVEENSDGYLITWHVGDLPGWYVETSDERFAVITDDHLEEIVVTWSVTARGVHHVFREEWRLPCEQAPGEYLTWSRHSHG
ncbi:hypothetical protein [Halostreptopolyspora alba]|uniref:Uncharacterized protein n=1 Tax=Halostreptopolyspora alba TaxID=2487137 RepID=A0A3N0DYT0_9ACTN|nr:hypothetical protein EFW17_22570 [Nocardiopsaceae bacterium YIM 96095]